jgi:hypothetical protein
MLAVLALVIVVLFFILLRTGILDNLPEYLNQARPDIQSWRPTDSNARRYDPNSDNRLEIFKDFFEEKEDEDQDS